MTQIQVDEPTDERAFEDGLMELLRAADRNGISVGRAWECCPDGEAGWEVEIVPLSTKQTN